MYCSQCGTQILHDDAAFCPNCGARIEARAQVRVQDPPAGNRRTAPNSRRITFNKLPPVAIIVIIVIAVIALAFVYTTFFKGTAGDSAGSGIPRTAGMTPTPAQGSATLPITTRPTPTPIPLPAKGVWVRVDYLGSWNGAYGNAVALITATDSGVRQYEVENASGTIRASFQKQDKSNHELIVEIYRNGAVMKRGNTTAPFGSVNISADVPIIAITTTRTPVVTTVTQKK
jgi:DNA-directed RNA polymerase subunit RPC12/RpoP